MDVHGLLGVLVSGVYMLGLFCLWGFLGSLLSSFPFRSGGGTWDVLFTDSPCIVLQFCEVFTFFALKWQAFYARAVDRKGRCHLKPMFRAFAEAFLRWQACQPQWVRCCNICV